MADAQAHLQQQLLLQQAAAAAAAAQQQQPQPQPQLQNATLPQYSVPAAQPQIPQSKYSQLLAIIEEVGKDIRPTYTGNKMSAERLKRSIIHARILVRECLLETERTARMN